MYSLDDLRSSYALLDYRADHGHSVLAIIQELGIDPETVMHVVEQRGHRAALTATGEMKKLQRLVSSTTPQPFQLTPEQQALADLVAASEMEAIAATLQMVKGDE